VTNTTNLRRPPDIFSTREQIASEKFHDALTTSSPPFHATKNFVWEKLPLRWARALYNAASVDRIALFRVTKPGDIPIDRAQGERSFPYRRRVEFCAASSS
jgi:hypothetical protein